MSSKIDVLLPGSFTLPGPDVVATDPTVDQPSHLQVFVDVVPGSWLAAVRLGNFGGTRVRELQIFNASIHSNKFPSFESDKWEALAAPITVDAGMAGFFDANSYVGSDDTKFYEEVNHLTSTPGLYAGVHPTGAVASSGLGDGTYNLWAMYGSTGNQATALKLVFIKE